MTTLTSNSYHERLIVEERSSSADVLTQFQPFLMTSETALTDPLLVSLTRQHGNWENLMSREQTAYALGQVTATSIMPPFSTIENGRDLIEYRVWLSDVLEAGILRDVGLVLEQSCRELNWHRMQESVYVHAFGTSGVAACIDTSAGEESLYFRYANEVFEELHGAGCVAEIPFKLAQLEVGLHQCFDKLLRQVRSRSMHWLTD